jgi:hypothetical protein
MDKGRIGTVYDTDYCLLLQEKVGAHYKDGCMHAPHNTGSALSVSALHKSDKASQSTPFHKDMKKMIQNQWLVREQLR